MPVKPRYNVLGSPPPAAHDPFLDHRARLERTQFEAEQRRTQALSDQRSPHNSPELRVRLWEDLHQVRLPKSPDHAVLLAIARQTEMTLADVREVQRQRAEPAQRSEG